MNLCLSEVKRPVKGFQDQECGMPTSRNRYNPTLLIVVFVVLVRLFVTIMKIMKERLLIQISPW